MTILYVNTASSAGGNGTTNATTGDNRAYVSLNDALTYLTGLGSLGDAYTIYCEGTAADTENCTQTVWNFTTTATNRLRIVGNNTSGKWNTSAYRVEYTNDDVLYNNYAAHVTMENLQVQLTSTTSDSSDYVAFRLSTANNDGAVDHKFLNCIAKGVRSGTDVSSGFFESDPNGQGGTSVRHNCIAYGLRTGFGSDESAWAETNCKNYNCLGIDNVFNYLGEQVSVNCISNNPGFGYGYGFYMLRSSAQSYNASDDNTADGTGSRIDQTFTFLNAGAEDYHLDPEDAGAAGYGIGPGSDATVPTADIDGNPRSGATCNIGPDEFVTAGGLSIPLVMAYYRKVRA